VEERLAALLAETRGMPGAAAARRERVRHLLSDSAARFARAGWGPDSHGQYDDPTTDLYDAAGLPR
jgi:hypothetical protein